MSNVTQIAKVCHEANRAYCDSLGEIQPSWGFAPQWQIDSARNGVLFHLANPEAGDAASHENWLAEKERDGWKYGAVKNPDAKEHPCIVPFDQLPPEQQAKDRLHYCGDEFHQANALEFDLRSYDFIWASPPCQPHVSLRWMHNAKQHDDLIPATRKRLIESGAHWCIENVPDAPLNVGLTLCGTMFGLGTEEAELRRHRNFELSFPVRGMDLPKCRHGRKPRVIGVYGGHGRDRRRTVNTQDFSTAQRREAMGIDWMNGTELSQAIPPAYSEFIGRAAIQNLNLARAA